MNCLFVSSILGNHVPQIEKTLISSINLKPIFILIRSLFLCFLLMITLFFSNLYLVKTSPRLNCTFLLKYFPNHLLWPQENIISKFLHSSSYLIPVANYSFKFFVAFATYKLNTRRDKQHPWPTLFLTTVLSQCSRFINTYCELLFYPLCLEYKIFYSNYIVEGQCQKISRGLSIFPPRITRP